MDMLTIPVVVLAIALAVLAGIWVRLRRVVASQQQLIAEADALNRRSASENAQAVAKADSLIQQMSDLRQRYAPVADVDARMEATKTEIERLEAERAAGESSWATRRAELEAQYKAGVGRYDALMKDVKLLEENLEDVSYGLYTPHFDFASSDEYKHRLEAVRAKQKAMVREGTAAISSRKWQVGKSTKDGEKMTKQYLMMLLRAYNAECDAAVAIVSWNNITKMEERLKKSFEAINELGGVMQMYISGAYAALKFEELHLAFEHEEKRYQEREEQRRIREQIREEEKVQREIEKAKEEAEKDEAQYQKALEKARAEAAEASGEALAKMNEKIATLQTELEQAQKLKERAISRAQLTKSGTVYVISNIGSFGERVFKIGLTRRLEPMERIYELGDASVPFPFDVHAMMYSENAPALENALHAHLAGRRANLVNMRKEFFQVALAEVGEFARQQGVDVEFSQVAEAKQFRESISIKEQRYRLGIPTHETESTFRATLFQEAAGAQQST